MIIRSIINNASCFVLVLILSFLFLANTVSAETKTFIKEYTYQASDEDSKNSSRTIALREVKRLLLEELGTYLESTTEVKNFKLTKDQIVTLTAGIVQTELIEEKWNTENLKYWLKAKITADSSEVIKSIDILRQDRQKTKELENTRKLSEELLKDNARLHKELASAKGSKKDKNTVAYKKTINDLSAKEWFENGYAANESGNYDSAIDAYTKAIEFNHKDAGTYNNRGIAYANIGKFNEAIKDYNKAIALEIKFSAAYSNRGNAYNKIGNQKQAIKDYNKAIELDPYDAMFYYNRGRVYYGIGNYQQAISDYTEAIKQINPGASTATPKLPDGFIDITDQFFDKNKSYTSKDISEVYFNRGLAYNRLDKYNQAIDDGDKAVHFNPNFAKAYAQRGNVYNRIGNYQQAISDYSKSIELNPRDSDTYFARGGLYLFSLQEYNQAINDFDIAIELNPNNANLYGMRAAAYAKVGNENKSINDFKTSARLGNILAQDYLKSNNIDW